MDLNKRAINVKFLSSTGLELKNFNTGLCLRSIESYETQNILRIFTLRNLARLEAKNTSAFQRVKTIQIGDYQFEAQDFSVNSNFIDFIEANEIDDLETSVCNQSIKIAFQTSQGEIVPEIGELNTPLPLSSENCNEVMNLLKVYAARCLEDFNKKQNKRREKVMPDIAFVAIGNQKFTIADLG